MRPGCFRSVSGGVMATAAVALMFCAGLSAEPAPAKQPAAGEQSSKSKLTCDVCGKVFKTPEDLRVHQAVQHGQTVPIAVPVLTELTLDPTPERVAGYLNLWVGSRYLFASQPRKAIPFLKKAVEGLAKSATAHLLLGKALTKTGEAEKGKQELEAAKGIDPALTPDSPLKKGVEYTFVPREFVLALQQAYGTTRRRTVPRPVLAELHAWLAGYYYDIGNAEPTVQAVREAIRLDPLNPHAHSFQGLIAAEQGDCARAANEVRTALQICSSDPWVRRASVLVTARCKTDCIPPEILLISPLAGERVSPRTNLVFEVHDNSGRLCHVTVNRISVSGRSRKLADIPGAKGRHSVHWRKMKWRTTSVDTIEIVARDPLRNTAQARFVFGNRR